VSSGETNNERNRRKMPFIGIVGDEKNGGYIKKQLIKKLEINGNFILYIKEKNIENIKNIKFETVIIARKFKNMRELRKILVNAKYIIINTDIINNLNFLENLESTVVTYGFNYQSTVTVSSVTEDSTLICIQRSIKNIDGNIIEPQEIEIENTENVNLQIAIFTTLAIYGKI
jgi:hypothetical protein